MTVSRLSAVMAHSVTTLQKGTTSLILSVHTSFNYKINLTLIQKFKNVIKLHLWKCWRPIRNYIWSDLLRFCSGGFFFILELVKMTKKRSETEQSFEFHSCTFLFKMKLKLNLFILFSAFNTNAFWLLNKLYLRCTTTKAFFKIRTETIYFAQYLLKHMNFLTFSVTHFNLLHHQATAQIKSTMS